jgi:hypothetical protein
MRFVLKMKGKESTESHLTVADPFRPEDSKTLLTETEYTVGSNTAGRILARLR